MDVYFLCRFKISNEANHTEFLFVTYCDTSNHRHKDTGQEKVKSHVNQEEK